ncbi:MAG: periplasmic nitrate reductase subunit alpha, partial [Desulfobulbus sp.]
MKINRRSFIKFSAASSALAAAGSIFPGISFAGWQNQEGASGRINWQKAPCRFCGTGCGVLIGMSGDRAVAVKGDPNCSVNKGLCCVKGFHSVQALYAKDRLKKAQIRKNGKMVEVPISEALDVIAA